jgi:hypothetical protein
MTIILLDVDRTQPQIFPKFHEEHVSLPTLFVHSQLLLQDS